MEKHAQPNAGLLDQRAMLEFVLKYIHKLNGDSSLVSVWGESAGASSILHHLTMPRNIERPLFRNALLQSPAYQWLWNRTGTVNDTFTNFAKKAQIVNRCPVADLKCLQSLSTTQLATLNQGLFQEAACNGIMPVGPTVDGELVPDLAPNLLRKGQFTKLDSILVSHVDLEVPYSNLTDVFSFIPLPVRKNPQSEAAFDTFLNEFLTGHVYKGIREKIRNRYWRGSFSDQIARAAAVIMDSSFLCNTRFLIDAYLGTAYTKTYAMDYAFGMNYTIGEKTTVYNASTHASDIIPTFTNAEIDYEKFIKCLTNTSGFAIRLFSRVLKNTVGRGMQTYFIKQALYNDPNYDQSFRTPAWFNAETRPCVPGSSTTCIGNVMAPLTYLIESPFNNNDYIDQQTNSTTCDFWANIVDEITQLASSQSRSGADEGLNQGYYNQLVLQSP